ncbi:hypothetical protein EVAR_96065_1 [Eumeta japonica]|uniref:Uncharacterized protein n=1 Tax=Eumeta variegata TaxID=151549 RepID=A0A4C1W875_EUMVA|nr:hypothetical protein EVAR_96065_1 [Eumeta japonica]
MVCFGGRFGAGGCCSLGQSRSKASPPSRLWSQIGRQRRLSLPELIAFPPYPHHGATSSPIPLSVLVLARTLQRKTVGSFRSVSIVSSRPRQSWRRRRRGKPTKKGKGEQTARKEELKNMEEEYRGRAVRTARRLGSQRVLAAPKLYWVRGSQQPPDCIGPAGLSSLQTVLCQRISVAFKLYWASGSQQPPNCTGPAGLSSSQTVLGAPKLYWASGSQQLPNCIGSVGVSSSQTVLGQRVSVAPRLYWACGSQQPPNCPVPADLSSS